MQKHITIKTIAFTFFILLGHSIYTQTPVEGKKIATPQGKLKFIDNKDNGTADSLLSVDSVYLIQRTASQIKIGIVPEDGNTYWRYRLLGETTVEAEVDPSAWISGMSRDTCCLTLDDLDAQSVYLMQFSRDHDMKNDSVLYSMLETTRCEGLESGQIKMIGLDHETAAMMCEISATSYEWVLKRSGGSTSRHIETSTNTIEWARLPSETEHVYKVRYMCQGIWSDYSAEATFTTKAREAVSCESVGEHDIYTSDLQPGEVKLNCKLSGRQYTWGLKPSHEENWTVHTTTTPHYTWQNLKPGTNYAYKVKVECEEDAWSDWSGTHYFATQQHYDGCSTPKSHHMSHSEVSYDAVTTYCAMDGAKYHWQMREKGSHSWKDHTGTHAQHRWTGLKPDTDYEYQVKVSCHNGDWTGWSYRGWVKTHKHDYGCTTAKGHHIDVKDVTYDKATVHCSIKGHGYHWQIREWGSYHWKDVNTIHGHHTWKNLKYGTTYEFRVKIKCGYGTWTDWSKEWKFTTEQHYGHGCMTAQAEHMDVTELHYDKATTYCAIDGYSYHWQLRRKGSHDWEYDGNTSGNYYHWKGLKHGTTYEFRVKIKCDYYTWTDWSGVWRFTTPHHQAYECKTPGSSHMSVKNLGYNKASTHCSIDNGYEYHWQLREKGHHNWTHDSQSSHHYSDWTGLKSSTTYEYRVKIKCDYNSWTNWSEPWRFTTHDYHSYGCTTPQAHHMSVTSLGYERATTHCAVEGAGYHWQLRPRGSTTWTHDKNSSQGVVHWTHLTDGTTYEYRVKIKCDYSTSTDWSGVWQFTTPKYQQYHCSTAQSHHMSVRDVGYDRASTYCAIEGAYEYHWQLRKKGSSNWTHDKTSDHHYMHWTGLHYGTKYQYRVKIKCDAWTWTSWSDPWEFTTHDHGNYGCGRPASHHMEMRDMSDNYATSYCHMNAHEYHWKMRRRGSHQWHEHKSSHNYHSWSNLYADTEYEYMLNVRCSNGWSGWSDLWIFRTYKHGHSGYGCSAPAGREFSVSTEAYDQFRVHLHASYKLFISAIRIQGSSEWAQHSSIANNIGWGGLQPDTWYEYRVKRECTDGTLSAWSAIRTWKTGTGSTGYSARNVTNTWGNDEHLEDVRLSVFPNPARSETTILGAKENTQITLLNMQGKIVKQVMASDVVKMSLDGMQNGIYQLVTTDVAGQTQIQKLVILQ